MTMAFDQLIVWLVVGAIAGTLAGWAVKRNRAGFGHEANILIGLIGAVIGGTLFDLLHLDIGLGSLTISGEDILAAFVGSLILLWGLAYLQGKR